jgi:uncharacterized membrane protein YdjX (TVP38/TMEM64 family)
METTFSTMALIHMVPFVPMNFMSFVAGISTMRFGNFFISCIGIIPGTSLFFILGANYIELKEYIKEVHVSKRVFYENEIKNLTIILFATVITVMLFIWITKVYDTYQLSKKYEPKENISNISSYHKNFLDPESKSLISR